VLKVFLEGTLVGGLEGTDAVAGDVPAEDFFVDIGELDAAANLAKSASFSMSVFELRTMVASRSFWEI
jgi:hypothetical protein